jgi:uncharacterized protein (TIGR02594 family)
MSLAYQQPEDPPWFDLALEEVGTHEVAGTESSPRIMEYAHDAKLKFTYENDETPWCAVFACAMLERTGHESPRSAWARDFLKWGDKCRPYVGCIVVLSRGEGSGHVGFYYGTTDDGRIQVLGGNQSDSVCLATFSKDRVLGYRTPRRPPPRVYTPPPAPPVETVDDTKARLRANGSRTIENAEQAQDAVTVVTVVAASAKAVEKVSDMMTDVAPVATDVKTLASFVVSNVWILGVLAVGLVVYSLTQIINARVDDDRSGKHIGRK